MRILITHQKGGVGKTTLTIALAKIFNLDKKTVAIVDNDQQGSVIQFADIYKELGINVYPILNENEILQLKEDIVLIDTPPYLLDELNSLSNLADLIIVPTKASILDLLAISRTVDIIKEEKMEDRAVILFNMIDKKLILNEEIKKQLEKLDIPVLDNYLTESVEYKNIILDDFKYKSKRQITKVVKEIFEKI